MKIANQSVAAPVIQHGWVYDYQTLIAGDLALLAALIAAIIAWRQLRATRDQLDELKRQATRDQAGRLRAARASLPAVLSTICDYAEAVGRALNSGWPAAAVVYPNDVDPLATYRVTIVVPPFPSETLASLERVVELTDSDPVADRIESILREAQVLGARCRKLGAGDDASVGNLASYVLQAGSIYARAESLFEYARRQSDTAAAEPLWERVYVALSIMGVHRNEVLEMARRERDNGDSPGEADTRPVY